MKRFATMMGALLLMPTLALANSDMVSIYELRQQGEAMERWTQTYDTPNGEVSVDVPIVVPDVERCPVVTVENRRSLLRSVCHKSASTVP